MHSPPKTDAFALGDMFFAICQRLHDFLGETVRPVAERRGDGSLEHQTYTGSLIRVHAWLRSLGKLNHPGDFQAILASSRALFEIAVDFTILRHDSQRHPCAQLLAWEHSAYMKYMVRLGSANPPGAAPTPNSVLSARFLRNEAARVEALRKQYWGGKHPPRWTGNVLEKDATAADALDARGFAEYYNERYPQVCWGVHGSGLAGFRRISEGDFPAIAAFGFAESAHFGLVAAEHALVVLNAFDSITEQRFKQFERETDLIRADVWTRYHPVES